MIYNGIDIILRMIKYPFINLFIDDTSTATGTKRHLIVLIQIITYTYGNSWVQNSSSQLQLQRVHKYLLQLSSVTISHSHSLTRLQSITVIALIIYYIFALMTRDNHLPSRFYCYLIDCKYTRVKLSLYLMIGIKLPDIQHPSIIADSRSLITILERRYGRPYAW